MYRLQRTVAFLLFALVLMSPGFVLAEGESTEPAVEQVAEGVAQETEKTTSKHSTANDPLSRQIQETYAAARKRSRRKSFKGYCGAYVANQLVVLGINTSYLSGSGKNTYDIYRNMDCTDGGYEVTAYSGKQYSLREAMEAILREDPAARNILVGFQRGVSSSGKKYGHALFIHGVLDGKVYFSDSSARTIGDVTYEEGEPIVCSLNAFVELYAEYKLDGVAHFEKSGSQPSSTVETDSASSENASTLG